ncbi:lipopolysaccharide biosynthesis protein [Pseudoalteromonas luteoviolacea]|uniref:Lipopolysaccharide biosynthesis protein n=1 Tax=Pseudoalteromonas luteoviolacea TaxID=43657 RepID=A0A0C1MLI5_9GAMM|nr:Wzz/FepE/Etk N-terminal domain-containing protein [Pseudoalteromonas luteoviolacea]KID57929.1 lipopolysaccharide biosynthesis protein [Pseudoalteromonas luteoviolacea]
MSSQKNFDENSVTLLELLQWLWRDKLVIIIIVAVFSVASVYYALSQADEYKADAILSPSNSQPRPGLGGELGGLAAIAGVNLGSSDSGQVALAIEVMQSRSFISEFIERHELVIPIMASIDWNSSEDKLIYDPEIYDVNTQQWLRPKRGLRKEKPSFQEAYEKFVTDIFTISKDKESNSYTVSMMHYSPYLAERWVNLIITDINKEMRKRAIVEASNNLTYLNLQLDKTSVVEMHSTLYELVKEQTKSLMLASAQEEFVFKIVDPAVTPEMKVKPKRALLCIIGSILGLVLGMAVSFIRFILRKDREKLQLQ